MNIFSRYVFRQSAAALLLILLSLAGIVWIALALRELNVVTSDRQDAAVLLKMTTLALPNLLVMIAPFALLISVVHVLNRLGGDSELIVHTAGGGTIWTLAAPLLILALIVSLSMSFVNHVAMPWSLKSLRQIVLQVRSDLLTQVIQPGRFSSPTKGLTFHIRDRALNGELEGLIMHDRRKPGEHHSYLADRGVLVKQDDTAYLVMSNGHIVRRTSDKDKPQIIKFETYAIDLNTFESGTRAVRIKARELYTTELKNPEIQAKASAKDRKKFVPEFHERFASTLYPFAFVLIALATIGNAQSTRQNRTQVMVAGLIAASSIRLLGLGLNNVVANAEHLFFFLYLLPVLAIVGALVTIVRNSKPRKPNAHVEALLDRVDSFVQSVLARVQRKAKTLPVKA
ncbi:MAG: LPS export ABC transporter permease LptF [Alphaproteobacteria bacterium]|nr:LPS export ABC transporter permease LptF [Alphaproteobacteria bacterium]